MVGFCDEKVHWLGPLNEINELRFPCFKTMLLHKSHFSSYATTRWSITCTGKWPSIPYTSLCVYACLLLLKALQLQGSFGLLNKFFPFGPVSDAVLPVCYFHICYVTFYIILPPIFRSS